MTCYALIYDHHAAGCGHVISLEMWVSLTLKLFSVYVLILQVCFGSLSSYVFVLDNHDCKERYRCRYEIKKAGYVLGLTSMFSGSSMDIIGSFNRT